MRKKGTLS